MLLIGSKRRGRKYELEQSINYWYDLNSNYEVFFNEYTWSKLLVIDVDEIDFVKNEKDKNYIINLIEEKCSYSLIVFILLLIK